MNNQMLIILALLFILFMKNIKENWGGGGGNPSGPCDGCEGLGCDPDSDHWKKCCGGPRWGRPLWCSGPIAFE